MCEEFVEQLLLANSGDERLHQAQSLLAEMDSDNYCVSDWISAGLFDAICFLFATDPNVDGKIVDVASMMVEQASGEVSSIPLGILLAIEKVLYTGWISPPPRLAAHLRSPEETAPIPVPLRNQAYLLLFVAALCKTTSSALEGEVLEFLVAYYAKVAQAKSFSSSVTAKAFVESLRWPPPPPPHPTSVSVSGSIHPGLSVPRLDLSVGPSPERQLRHANKTDSQRSGVNLAPPKDRSRRLSIGHAPSSDNLGVPTPASSSRASSSRGFASLHKLRMPTSGNIIITCGQKIGQLYATLDAKTLIALRMEYMSLSAAMSEARSPSHARPKTFFLPPALASGREALSVSEGKDPGAVESPLLNDDPHGFGSISLEEGPSISTLFGAILHEFRQANTASVSGQTRRGSDAAYLDVVERLILRFFDFLTAPPNRPAPRVTAQMYLLLSHTFCASLETHDSAVLKHISSLLQRELSDVEEQLYCLFRHPVTLVGYPVDVFLSLHRPTIPRYSLLPVWSAFTVHFYTSTRGVQWDVLQWFLAALCHQLVSVAGTHHSLPMQCADLCLTLLSELFETFQHSFSVTRESITTMHYFIEIFDAIMASPLAPPLLLNLMAAMFVERPGSMVCYALRAVTQLVILSDPNTLFSMNPGNASQRGKRKKSWTPRSGSTQRVESTFFWPDEFDPALVGIRLIRHYIRLLQLAASPSMRAANAHADALDLRNSFEATFDFLINPVDGVALSVLSSPLSPKTFLYSAEILRFLRCVSGMPQSPLLLRPHWTTTYTRFLYLSFLLSYNSLEYARGERTVLEITSLILETLGELVRLDPRARRKALQLGIVHTLVREVELEHAGKELRERHIRRRSTFVRKQRESASLASDSNSVASGSIFIMSPSSLQAIPTGQRPSASDIQLKNSFSALSMSSVPSGSFAQPGSPNAGQSPPVPSSPKRLVIPKLSLGSAPPPLYFTSNGDTGCAASIALQNTSLGDVMSPALKDLEELGDTGELLLPEPLDITHTDSPRLGVPFSGSPSANRSDPASGSEHPTLSPSPGRRARPPCVSVPKLDLGPVPTQSPSTRPRTDRETAVSVADPLPDADLQRSHRALSRQGSFGSFVDRGMYPLDLLRDEAKFSEHQRSMRHIYVDDNVHTEVLYLLFLLLVKSDGTLDEQYLASYTICSKKVNILYYVEAHLNHRMNRRLIPRLAAKVSRCQNIGVRVLFQLLSSRGEILDHTFKVGSKIGIGAYGVVCNCAYNAMPNTVDGLAVKMIPIPRQISDRANIVDLHSEVLVMLLNQDVGGICELVDFGNDGSTYRVIMKYYGMSLRQWRDELTKDIERKSQETGISVSELNTVMMPVYFSAFLEVLRIVMALQLRGVAHFDLKCDNVFLQRTRGPVGNEYVELFLGDFGEAELAGSALDVDENLSERMSYQTSRRAKGTEVIRSPECLVPHKFVDRRRKASQSGFQSDVWSLGCLFYELIVGHHLFQEDHYMKLVHRVTHEDGEILGEEHRKQLNNDAQVIALLLFILCRDPERRPFPTEIEARVRSIMQARGWVEQGLAFPQSASDSVHRRDSVSDQLLFELRPEDLFSYRDVKQSQTEWSEYVADAVREDNEPSDGISSEDESPNSQSQILPFSSLQRKSGGKAAMAQIFPRLLFLNIVPPVDLIYEAGITHVVSFGAIPHISRHAHVLQLDSFIAGLASPFFTAVSAGEDKEAARSLREFANVLLTRIPSFIYTAAALGGRTLLVAYVVNEIDMGVAALLVYAAACYGIPVGIARAHFTHLFDLPHSKLKSLTWMRTVSFAAMILRKYGGYGNRVIADIPRPLLRMDLTLPSNALLRRAINQAEKMAAAVAATGAKMRHNLYQCLCGRCVYELEPTSASSAVITLSPIIELHFDRETGILSSAGTPVSQTSIQACLALYRAVYGVCVTEAIFPQSCVRVCAVKGLKKARALQSSAAVPSDSKAGDTVGWAPQNLLSPSSDSPDPRAEPARGVFCRVGPGEWACSSCRFPTHWEAIGASDMIAVHCALPIEPLNHAKPEERALPVGVDKSASSVSEFSDAGLPERKAKATRLQSARQELLAQYSSPFVRMIPQSSAVAMKHITIHDDLRTAAFYGNCFMKVAQLASPC